MHYTSFKHLYESGAKLCYGDTFTALNIVHTVATDHAHCRGESNAKALNKLLGPSYESIAYRVYGSKPLGGSWPTSNSSDYTALTNLVLVLLAADEAQSASRSILRGDRVIFNHLLEPFGNLKRTDGLIGAGTVLMADSSDTCVRWDNGEEFWIPTTSILKVNSLLTIKPSKDEYVQEPSVTDKREERSTGSGVSSGGSESAIGRRYPGNPASIEDSNAEIRQGKVSGTVLLF